MLLLCSTTCTSIQDTFCLLSIVISVASPPNERVRGHRVNLANFTTVNLMPHLVHDEYRKVSAHDAKSTPYYSFCMAFFVSSFLEESSIQETKAAGNRRRGKISVSS